MRNFILASAALLCSLFWIFVSESESRSVEVQSGEDVTLLCSNFSTVPTLITWFKVVNRSEPQCHSSIFQFDKPALYCSGFQKEKFELTSNSSTLFLKIKPVDPSDAGLYFCGYRVGDKPVIVDTTFLEVQDMQFGLTTLLSIVFAGLTVFLILIITYLAVGLIKLQRERIDKQNPRPGQSLGSDGFDYSAATYFSKVEGNLAPALDQDVETNSTFIAPE